MGPIEVLWGTLVLVFIIVALIRGYNRELGVTVLVLLVLFVELQFANTIESVLRQRVLPQLVPQGPQGQPQEQWANFILMLAFQLPILIIVFWAYAGRTLVFPGTPPRGMEGVFFNAIIGLVNGYLVIGSIWYYMAKYKYPLLEQWGLLQASFTPFAQRAVDYLPPALFKDQPAFLGAFAAALLFIYVRR